MVTYFRCISFILSGTEEFHPEVRKAKCDLIEVLVSDLITILHLFIVPHLMFNCYFPFYLLI